MLKCEICINSDKPEICLNCVDFNRFKTDSTHRQEDSQSPKVAEPLKRILGEKIQGLVGVYYQDCNKRNPPAIPLAVVIAEIGAEKQLEDDNAKVLPLIEQAQREVFRELEAYLTEQIQQCIVGMTRVVDDKTPEGKKAFYIYGAEKVALQRTLTRLQALKSKLLKGEADEQG